MSDIESFEASDTDVFGDILSQRPAAREKIKLGLLACGYFEYWRMFSAQFKENVLGDLDRIAQRLRQDFDVVFPCVVDTMDAAEEAGRAFAEQDIDLLVVVEGTYLPDFMTLHAIEHVAHVPVVLFTTQVEEDISPEDDYEQMMRNSALIGTTQLAGTFQKMGWRYESVVGSIKEERPYREIVRLARTIDVARRLRQLNIGIIGHVFRGMYDLENDKTKIKGTLGPNVIYVDIGHLLDQWKNVTEADARQVAESLASRFSMRGITDDDLFRSCKLGVAMERLMERLRLDALCFLGQHHIEKETGAPARLGASMMLEKGDYLVASEGDLAGLIMMHVMQWLTGSSPLQAEWGQYDAAHNALFIVGHGVASPALASGDDAVTLTPAPEEWGFEEAGVNLEFIVEPGPVTMAHLLDTAQGWQMLISGGESLEYPCLPCGEIHALVQIAKPVKEYLTEVHRRGTTHHLILVHGDIREDLAILCRFLDITPCVI